MLKVLRWLLRDLHLKIIALMVSFGFWIYVSLDRTYQVPLELPLRISNLRENLIVTSELPAVVVTFSGRGRELLKLKIRHPWINLNLGEARLGKYVATILPTSIVAEAMSLTVVKTSLAEVELFVSEKAEKLMAPTIVTHGSPKAGFTLRNALSRAMVKVAGPKDRIQHLRQVLTEPIDLNNQSASFACLVALAPPVFDNISLSPCSINVAVAIEEEQERIFTDVPVHVILPSSAAAHIATRSIDSLVISGPKSIVTVATLEDFSITIDLRGRIRGRYSVPAEIRLPKYLRLVASKPKLFDVSLR